jgi:hypothetical protein
LTAVLAGGDPQDDPEKEVRERVERQGSMRETSVQVHGGGNDGGLRDDNRDAYCEQGFQHVEVSFFVCCSACR